MSRYTNASNDNNVQNSFKFPEEGLLRRHRRDAGIKRGPLSEEVKAKISAKAKGRTAHNKGKKESVKHVYYTNGEISIRIAEFEVPPEGFVRGRLKRALTDEERKSFDSKIKSTKLERYGDSHYNNLQQGIKTKVLRYNDPHYNNREAAAQTCLRKYGVSNPSQSSVLMAGAAQRSKQSAIKSGRINKSKPEDLFYNYLCIKFGKDDIYTQYRDEIRYPFFCDFYIKSLDLFIELNLHWTHGFHPYNSQSLDDREKLCEMQERVRQNPHSAYTSAIKTWTITDPLKQQTAKDNKLNYITCYNQRKLLAHISSDTY